MRIDEGVLADPDRLVTAGGPVLAATALDLWKHGAEIGPLVGWNAMAMGLVTSFVVSLVVIRAFLGFLRSYSLEVFGWYRVLAGLLIWIFVR